MKNLFINLINNTFGKLRNFKLIKFNDGPAIKICTKPELDLKKIKEDFPNGVPEGHPLYGYA